jgi:hypothetical protein
MITAAALFALGAAFAAQPVSIRADRLSGQPTQPTSWEPGTDEVMSKYESILLAMPAPPAP